MYQLNSNDPVSSASLSPNKLDSRKGSIAANRQQDLNLSILVLKNKLASKTETLDSIRSVDYSSSTLNQVSMDATYEHH